MALNAITVFLAGWIAAFLGTLPFGPINLSVVDTTIKKSFQSALWLSLAAALVEIGQSFIALHCSMFISDLLSTGIWVKIGAIVLFVGLGLFFFLKKDNTNTPSQEVNKKKNDSSFLKGLVISLLNPQAIPFWIFVLTYLDTTNILHLDTTASLQFVIIFLLGVSLGKLAALLLFSFLSKLISKRSDFLAQWMNKIIGSILIVIGLYQVISLAIG